MFAAAGACAATICTSLCCKGCKCIHKHVMMRSARAGYTILFVATMLFAFLMQHYARELVNLVPGVHFYKNGEDVWYGTQAVYRMTFGNFIFFSGLSLILIGTRFKGDLRHEEIQQGNWVIKMFIWLACLCLPFLIPGNMEWFDWISRIGSGFYLIIQTLILLDFVYSLNDAWYNQGEHSKIYLWAMLATVILLYAAHGTFLGMGFHFFKPAGAGACSFNVTILVWTLIVTVVFSIMSVLEFFPTGSLFPASALSVYCGFLMFTAFLSEPDDYACNGMGDKRAAKGTSLFLGLCVTLVTVVYSAIRAGSNTGTFFFSRSDDDDAPLMASEEGHGTSAEKAPEEQTTSRSERAVDDFTPVPYNYSFFHLIFSLASLYVAMLLTDWGVDDNQNEEIGVSWTSVWVKLGSQIFTALLYLWTLLAPVLFPDRNFS